MSQQTEDAPRRRRDPRRRERILDAAATLVAERGYHEVGMADIGIAAGITGSGVYRHFGGKSAVLVALFDRVIDELAEEAGAIVEADAASTDVLRRLVAGQARVVTEQRMVMQVYLTESTSLPESDRHRLRRKQRMYVEEWVHVLGTLRPGMPDADLRALVHAAIGAIQSALFYHSGLAPGAEAALLSAAAEAVLFAEPAQPESKT